MSIRFKVSPVLMVVLILSIGCGKAEPTVTSVSPTNTLVSDGTSSSATSFPSPEAASPMIEPSPVPTATAESVATKDTQEKTCGGNPDAECLIAACAKAMGGIDKVDSLETMRLAQDWPDHDLIRYEIKRPNLVKMGDDLVFDGERAAWLKGKNADGTPRIELVPEEEWKDFEMDIGWYVPAFFDHPAEYMGTETVDGIETHILQVTLPLGAVMTYNLDAQTYLVYRAASDITIGEKEHHMERTYSDYRVHDGIMYPHAFTYEGRDGTEVLTATMEKLEFNIPLEDERFSVPLTTPEPSAGTVLLVFGQRFIPDIYTAVRPAFEEAGYRVIVASRKMVPLKGKNVNLEVDVDLLLEDVRVEDYDAILFNCDNDITFGSARAETDRIAQEAVAQGKVLAAICSGPRVLAYAHVVEGKTTTGEPSETCRMLEQGGATCTGASVERDGLLITARDRYASRAFVEMIIGVLQEDIDTTNSSVPITFTKSEQDFGDTRTFSIVIEDVDLDNDNDVFIANYIGPSKLWLNDGNGVFVDSYQRFDTPEVHGAAIADLNGDGYPDIFLLSHATPSKVYFNDGAGAFTDSQQNIGLATDSPGMIVLGDVDGDGDADAFISYPSDPNRLWLNDGTGIFSVTDTEYGDSGKSFAMVLADFNGDTFLDLFLSMNDQPDQVWMNDGSGNFANSGQTLGSSVGDDHVDSQDIDGDGDQDVVVANSVEGIKIWLNQNNTGVFVEAGPYFEAGAWHGKLCDVDLDGDFDLITTHWTNGNKLWLNDSSESFTSLGQIFESTQALSIACGKLDADDDNDVVFGNNNGSGGNALYFRDNGPSRIYVPSAPVVDVPLGPPPVLDGILEEDEWASGLQDKLSDGSELLLMHDGEYLYVGIRASAKGSGVGSICVDRGEQVAILHSSAALGTSIYEKDGAEWQQIQEFTWQCRDTDSSAAAQTEREEFLQAEGWLANNGRMGVPEEVEYQIAIPKGSLQLAVTFLGPSGFDSVAAWPQDLSDDCQNIELITGPTPGRLQFSPQTWMTVSPADGP